MKCYVKRNKQFLYRELAIAANLQVMGGKAPTKVCMSISRRLNRSLETASRGGHICPRKFRLTVMNIIFKELIKCYLVKTLAVCDSIGIFATLDVKEKKSFLKIDISTLLQEIGDVLFFFVRQRQS